jgi:hypothetical protein
MNSTKKINYYKNYKKYKKYNTKKEYFGGMMKALRGIIQSQPSQQISTNIQNLPPPPQISDNNVRAFNSLNMGWQIEKESTYYEVFNVNSTANESEINTAFKNITRAIRPLTKGSSNDKSTYINLRSTLRETLNKLIDPISRSEYDNLLLLYPRIPINQNRLSSSIPSVAPGINVTFSETQQPNPILIRNGPVSQPIRETLVGRKIINLIDETNKKHPKNDSLQFKLINLSEKMLEYPASSHLENYMLLGIFLDNSDAVRLISSLNEILTSQKSRFSIEYDFDIINKMVQIPDQQLVNGKIDAFRLFSIMILSSRLCAKYNLRNNPECELFINLNNLFENGNGTNFTSNGISHVIENFIRTNNSVTLNYIKNLINGKTIYNIYTSNYKNSEREITKTLITERLKKWISIANLNDKIIDSPISYIFNMYSNKEKSIQNKKSELCKIIAENSADTFGKKNTDSLLPQSVFNIEKNEDIDFANINDFFHKLSPAPVQKKLIKQKKDGKKDKTRTRKIKKTDS